jgi:phenylalanyl-tRNA synthetase alpha chain
MHDTFYFPDGRLLRTHTSPVQIRELRKGRLPLAMIMPGRTHRCFIRSRAWWLMRT